MFIIQLLFLMGLQRRGEKKLKRAGLTKMEKPFYTTDNQVRNLTESYSRQYIYDEVIASR